MILYVIQKLKITSKPTISVLHAASCDDAFLDRISAPETSIYGTFGPTIYIYICTN